MSDAQAKIAYRNSSPRFFICISQKQTAPLIGIKQTATFRFVIYRVTYLAQGILYLSFE